jgi:hypothetical protein
MISKVEAGTQIRNKTTLGRRRRFVIVDLSVIRCAHKSEFNLQILNVHFMRNLFLIIA